MFKCVYNNYIRKNEYERQETVGNKTGNDERGKKPRKHQKTLWNVNLIGNIRLPS